MFAPTGTVKAYQAHNIPGVTRREASNGFGKLRQQVLDLPDRIDRLPIWRRLRN